MPKLEYMTSRIEARGMFKSKVDAEEVQSRLNYLAVDGWELVAAPTDSINGWTAGVILILKRPTSD